MEGEYSARPEPKSRELEGQVDQAVLRSPTPHAAASKQVFINQPRYRKEYFKAQLEYDQEGRYEHLINFLPQIVVDTLQG
jgi:hypothetical protein